MSHRLTILGCGSSGGVPRIGSMWGQCDPQQPKNRRRRCAILVERIESNGHTTVLVDTPPDLREQLLDVRLSALDAVLYTHDHADHTHGIDDLRMVAYAMKKRIPCYMDPVTRAALETRFAYCFKAPEGSSYPGLQGDRDLRRSGALAAADHSNEVDDGLVRLAGFDREARQPVACSSAIQLSESGLSLGEC